MRTRRQPTRRLPVDAARRLAVDAARRPAVDAALRIALDAARRLAVRAGLLCSAVVGGGCATTPPVPLESVAFAAGLGVDLEAMQTTASGVRVQDVSVGHGAVVRAGSRVALYYVGWLPDGTRVDAVAQPDEPVRFRLGSGEVIRGWEDGIAGMRVGGQRRLVIPSPLAYGARRVGAVPPHATLVFLVHLVDAS